METIISDDVLTVRHFSVTTFTVRSEAIWANIEYRAFFKHRNPVTVTQHLLAPQGNIYQRDTFTSYFLIAVFILKKVLEDLSAHMCGYM